MSFSRIENSYRKKGYQVIAGIDEVGRGALAGPLVAAVVILKPYTKLVGLRDSKHVTERNRERLSAHIVRTSHCVSYGQVEADEIDKIGIAKANRMAFERALQKMDTSPDFVLADYFNFENLPYPNKGVLGGDKKVRVIAAASVVAKVYRDNLMKKYHEQFPQYGFGEHVGYGTLKHRRAIAEHGPCELHRKSFRLT